jgi:L-malate glycosyltransferase
MRVLHVDTERGFRGGQRQLLLLCVGLSDAGIDSEVAVRAGSALETECRGRGIATFPLDQAVPWDPRAMAGLGRKLSSVDIVHAHASHALGAAVGALAVAGGPPLVASRRVDFSIGRPPLNRLKYGSRVARFLAISAAVARVLQDGGVGADRIRVVPSAVEPLPTVQRSRDDVRGDLGVDRGTTLALTTAALVDHKDHPTAVRAVSRCAAPVHLVIAGEGEDRAKVEACIRAEGVADRVTLLGHRTDVPDLLAAADVYVASSHMEGLGTALMDAGLARLPVVATRAGGIPEVVEHGRTGILVPPRDHAALAAALDGLASDAARREALGIAGAERVARRFSVAQMVEGTLAVYREVIG